MSTPPVPLRPPRKPVNLTKPATIFALTFGFAFGVCSISGISLSNGGNARTAELLIGTAVVVGGVCVLCLLGIAIFAYVRSVRRRA
jgi:hypothetical protein